MSNNSFKKFIDKPLEGAKKKEAIKQEKRRFKKEKQVAIDARKREKRAAALAANLEPKFNRKESKFQANKFDIKPETKGNFKKNITEPNKPKHNTTKQSKEFKPIKYEQKTETKTRFGKSKFEATNKLATQPQKMVDTKKFDQKTAPKKHFEKAATTTQTTPKPIKTFDTNKVEHNKRIDKPAVSVKLVEAKKFDPKIASKKHIEKADSIQAKPKPIKAFEANTPIKKELPTIPVEKSKFKKNTPSRANTKPTTEAKKAIEAMPLNKYVAYAGICGRREAAELIRNGTIMVNGKMITEPAYKVQMEDKIVHKGKQLFTQKNLVYILLNKPKDCITTVTDPQGRRTVIDHIKHITTERVFPVGRLDRNTTGVLLFTNDGELSQKLTHPKFGVQKIYEVQLDKPVTKKHLDQIATGVELDDGIVQADSVAYAHATQKNIIGIEIHSGKNRVVRRIFEKLGYDVRALDRVMFANLTKKNVERGKCRLLTEKEVRLLKFMNQSFVKEKRNVEK
jgi:23S rRNA pseudouridine2605 synthase